MTQAESDVHLALYIGESFVEAHLSHNQKTLHFNRWYLGKDGFKSGLQKFLQEAGVEKISKAVVASRFVEKIFAYRLGGSVATLTTKGFENWAGIRQPQNPKVGPLSSNELIFGLDERCNTQGVITKVLAETEIAELIEKLRQKQAKRICIHFLNACKNPSNQNKLKEILTQENFEVFIPSYTPNCQDEVSQWRQNLLNASLSGTFDEVQEEINEGLKSFLPEGERALFFSSEAQMFDRENHLRLSSLWGAHGAWVRALKKQLKENFDILYLGLEHFCLLNANKTLQNWNSPWGAIHAPQVKNTMLSLQPTTAIELNSWGELSFAPNALGFEPGPMFMGRGQNPTFLDLWEEKTTNLKGVAERRSPQGLQKFKNQLLALNKSVTKKHDSEMAMLSYLREIAIHKMTTEVALHCENKKIICLGALAPLFVEDLKKRIPDHQFDLLAETETSSLLSRGH